MNGLPITSLPVALGRERKLTGIELSSPVPGAASHRLTDDDLANGHAVLVYPLDLIIRDFHLPQPAVLKVDVDGSEADVIAGAAATLLGVQHCMIECSAQTVGSVTAMLGVAGLHGVRRTRRLEPTQWNIEYVR